MRPHMVRFGDPQWEQVEAVAVAEDRSPSAVLREAMRLYWEHFKARRKAARSGKTPATG